MRKNENIRTHPGTSCRGRVLLGLSSVLLAAGTVVAGTMKAIALPPPEDTPEEVSRTEIVLEARSPVDGDELTASEYAELQAELRESENAPSIDPETRQLIFLLQVRKALNVILPFSVF